MGLGDSMVVTTIPVTDFEVALPFYRDVLGLTLLEETAFSMRFGAGGGLREGRIPGPAA